MGMTPRQAAIRAHFHERDKALDELRMFWVMRLAFSGDEKAVKAWMDTLNLPS